MCTTRVRILPLSIYYEKMRRVMNSVRQNALRTFDSDVTATAGIPADVNATGPPATWAAGPMPAANPIVRGMTFCS